MIDEANVRNGWKAAVSRGSLGRRERGRWRMWWKLSVLAVVTTALVIALIPIRTHAVRYDPSNPPPRPSFAGFVGSMYLTPVSGLSIAFVLAVATFIALRIIRGQS